eukprot:PhF_6_TR5624/c0_g1_i1/m.8156
MELSMSWTAFAISGDSAAMKTLVGSPAAISLAEEGPERTAMNLPYFPGSSSCKISYRVCNVVTSMPFAHSTQRRGDRHHELDVPLVSLERRLQATRGAGFVETGARCPNAKLSLKGYVLRLDESVCRAFLVAPCDDRDMIDAVRLVRYGSHGRSR